MKQRKIAPSEFDPYSVTVINPACPDVRPRGNFQTNLALFSRFPALPSQSSRNSD